MKELVLKAKEARQLAYVPYSNFKVGAAVLLKDGEMVGGCNVENASYGLCNCAERTALFTTYAKGYKKEDIVAVAVIGDTQKPISPCGACRQVMQELVPMDASIFLANLNGETKEFKNSELLPFGFSELI